MSLSLPNTRFSRNSESGIRGAYCYGFNSQEKETQITGGETHTSAEFWMYDARAGRRWQLDPKPIDALSGYSCLLNSPIICFDIQGDTIKLVEAVNVDYTGNYVNKENQVSPKTEEVLKDIVKTKEGREYLALFAVKDQVIGGYKFTQNGKYSNHVLTIQDYSLREFNWVDRAIPFVAEGAYVSRVHHKGKHVEVFIQLMSCNTGSEKYRLGETFGHEAFLHGTDGIKEIDEFIKGGKLAFEAQKKKDPSGEEDHKALRTRDKKHSGFVKYEMFMTQMSKIDARYNKHMYETGDK